jgi:hypothetical protein
MPELSSRRTESLTGGGTFRYSRAWRIRRLEYTERRQGSRMDGTRRTTVVYAVVLGVLVAAAGAFVALFLVERSAASEVGGQVTVTERELSGARDRLGTAQSTVDELADGEQVLRDEVDALRACADPTKASIDAVRAGDDQALSDSIDQMILYCGR